MIINESLLKETLDQALANGADFAEVFVENTYKSNISMKDSQANEASVGRLYGAGIRLFYGTEQIYTYTNDLTQKGLLETAKTASLALKGEKKLKSQSLQHHIYDSIHKYNILAWDISKGEKIKWLHRYDQAARSYDGQVTQVIASISETHQEVQIANSEGLLTSETRQYCNTGIQVVAEKNGKTEDGYERIGALASSDFLTNVDYEKLAVLATKEALLNLKADYAPAGEMPVVIDNAFGGVIFHEACGHGLETTSVAKNASVFCDKLNQRLAQDCVTAIDDGTIAQAYGSLAIDDEGLPTQKTVLIENGILKSYIVDKLGAKKTGYTPTGSGRRQSYKFAPTSRMRNTFIAAGNSSLEEMIKDIDYGLYAKKMGGGSVTPGNGGYNFAVREAYLIKNGKIDQPVKGASLIGTGIETLARITKVGNDLELAAGTCGSISGMIPTTVGQPAIQLSKLTVGGRA